MTKTDADKLKVQVGSMTVEQLRCLWRWITLVYMGRCKEDLEKRFK